MADLGTIGIAIEIRGREALRQIEQDMVGIDRTAKSAARSFEAFERAGLKSADTFRQISDAAKKRLTDEQRITQELVKQRNASDQLAKANAQRSQSQIGSNLGLGARGISAGASASAIEGEIERLRNKFDGIYASSQLYERSLNEINQAHRVGVLSVKQHEAAVESLNLEYQNFQNGMAQAGNRFQQYSAQTRSGMSGMGMAIQQTGYQVGDFLVQVQGGTNWMVAFGQQATQLVGILPAMGAGFMGLSMGALVALSAGLGIAIPLVTAIGAAFMRTSDSANAGAKEIDVYAEALQSLTSEIQKNQDAFLQAKFGVETAGRAQALQQEVTLQKEVADAQGRILQMEQQLDSFRSGRGAAYINLAISGKKEEIALEEENLATLQEKLQIISAQNEAQRMLNGGLSVAAGIQKGLVYDKQVELRLSKEQEIAEAKAEELARRKKDAFHAMAGEMGAVSSSIFEAADSAERLAGVDIASGIAEAANTAMTLANNLGVSFDVAKKLAAGGYSDGPTVFDPRDPRFDPAKAAQEGQFGFTYGRSVSSSASGGGGGGGRQTNLRKEIDLTKELTQVERDRQNVLRSTESSLTSGFMAMVEGTKSVKGAFKTMAYDIVRELYRVLVVQRLVGAISGGFGMFTGSSTGSLGLPFGLATGGTMMPNQPYLVGEHGPELVIPRHSGTVVNANQTAGAMSESGGFTQNLSINVSGSDAAMVRTEIAKMIPQITNATKSAMIDAKQRGGQMAQAFR